MPVLSSIATALGKSHSDIVIFDPFYCQGSVRRNLAALGFTNVINEKQVPHCLQLAKSNSFGSSSSPCIRIFTPIRFRNTTCCLPTLRTGYVTLHCMASFCWVYHLYNGCIVTPLAAETISIRLSSLLPAVLSPGCFCCQISSLVAPHTLLPSPSCTLSHFTSCLLFATLTLCHHGLVRGLLLRSPPFGTRIALDLCRRSWLPLPLHHQN